MRFGIAVVALATFDPSGTTTSVVYAVLSVLVGAGSTLALSALTDMIGRLLPATYRSPLKG